MAHLFVRAFVRFTALIFAAASLVHAAAGQDLVVGQVASKTNSSSAELARGVEIGYRIYFEEINAAGGIFGRRLTLRNVNDDFTASKMVESTKILAADPNVIALAGYVGSGGLAQSSKERLLKISEFHLWLLCRAIKRWFLPKTSFRFVQGMRMKLLPWFAMQLTPIDEPVLP